MATGKFLFAIQDVIIKEMSAGYPVHQIMAIRGSVAIPLLLLLIHFRGGLGALRRHRPALHLLRGALMLIAFLSFYVALAGTSLTTATALFFSAPFFITLLSIPLLGEKVGAVSESALQGYLSCSDPRPAVSATTTCYRFFPPFFIPAAN